MRSGPGGAGLAEPWLSAAQDREAVQAGWIRWSLEQAETRADALQVEERLAEARRKHGADRQRYEQAEEGEALVGPATALLCGLVQRLRAACRVGVDLGPVVPGVRIGCDSRVSIRHERKDGGQVSAGVVVVVRSEAVRGEQAGKDSQQEEREMEWARRAGTSGFPSHANRPYGTQVSRG